MNIPRITSVTLSAAMLALAFLLSGCAAKREEDLASLHTSPVENYSNVPLAPSIHGPSVAYANPMWKAYASRGQAFANCGGVSAAPPRETSTKAPSGARSRPRGGGQTKTGGPAAKATVKDAPKPPQDAALAGVVCPDGCVPAPGQQGASGQRGPTPAVPGAAKTTTPQTSPPPTSASLPGSPQTPPPASSVTATPAPVTATPAPVTATPAPALAPHTAGLPGSPPPSLTNSLLQSPEIPPSPTAAPAATTAPIVPLFTPPDSARQDASAPLEMPATAPPIPTGAALGSMSSGAPR